MKKLSDAQTNEVIKLYKEGQTPIELSIQFGIANNSVTRLLRNHGIPRTQLIRFSRSSETDQLIINEYISGDSSEVIAKKYKSNEKTIRRILKENGVQMRPFTQKKRKYKINENFFETVDTEEKAYFLGLLYADGSLSKRGTCIKLCLHEKDIDILEKFSNIIYGFMKNRVLKKVLQDGSISKYIIIDIYSIKMQNDLCKLGCIPAKTFTIRLPKNNIVPDHLIHHFIRGYFDGDGCICIAETHRPRIDISSNTSFIQDIIDYFHLHNINFYKMTINKENNLSGNTQIHNKQGVIDFYNHIYNGATIYMNRKYNTFQQMFSLLKEVEDNMGFKNFAKYGTEYIPKYNGNLLNKKYITGLPDADKESITDFLFSFYRENGFPYVKLTDAELLHDFAQLKNMIPIEKDHILMTNYRSGLPNFKHFSPHFYEVNSSEKDRLSMLDTFNDDDLLRKVIRNRIDGEFNLSGNMLKQGLANSKLAFKASIFNPSIAKFIYQKYTNANDIVYDYSAGFGQRLLGALSVEHSLTYVGVDPMQRSIDSNNNIFSFYKNNIPMFNKQAELVCIGSENYKDPKYEGQISLAFSSPAYYNHELYENNPSQAYFSNSYMDFINKWWRQTVLNIKYLLKPQGLLALNIKDKLELFDLGTDMKNVLIEYGFTLIDTYQIQITRNNIFSRKDGKFKYEPIYIFQKE